MKEGEGGGGGEGEGEGGGGKQKTDTTKDTETDDSETERHIGTQTCLLTNLFGEAETGRSCNHEGWCCRFRVSRFGVRGLRGLAPHCCVQAAGKSPRLHRRASIEGGELGLRIL